MRLVFALALLSLWSVAFVTAQPAPTHPIPAKNMGSMEMCLLDGLEMGGGLSIMQQFNWGKFTYTCTCNDWSKIGYGANSPYVTVDLMDSGSTASIWFNGAPIHSKALGNGLTGKGPLKSIPLATASNRWKRGASHPNLIQIGISCAADAKTGEHYCHYNYEIECTDAGGDPDDGGYVQGDPQFQGLRGQNFQVHGVDGEIYNIVSDADLQYNSRFVFLSEGKCPIVNGRRQKGCWSHPGSYLGELGLKTRAGDRIRVLSGPAAIGFEAIEVNGRALAEGETVFLDADLGSVTFNSTHLASVQVGNWDFVFDNSDRFINQRVRVLDASRLRSHGLLGQTWREVTYPNAIKYIQGSVDDYTIRDADLFGDSFVFNAFN